MAGTVARARRRVSVTPRVAGVRSNHHAGTAVAAGDVAAVVGHGVRLLAEGSAALRRMLAAVEARWVVSAAAPVPADPAARRVQLEHLSRVMSDVGRVVGYVGRVVEEVVALRYQLQSDTAVVAGQVKELGEVELIEKLEWVAKRVTTTTTTTAAPGAANGTGHGTR